MKKRTLMLHIGATKTGSSALQATLYANREMLKRKGILYPETGVASGAHHNLFSAIHPSAWKMHGFSGDDDRTSAFHNMAAEINTQFKRDDFEKLILTSEYLWGVFQDGVYRTFLESFEDYNIEIVAAVRRVDYWAEANYIQAAKGGLVCEFKEWVDKFSRTPVAGYDFNKVISGWSESLKSKNVHIVPYEPRNAKTFLSNISTVLLGRHVSQEIPAPDSRKDNPSPTKEGIELIQDLYRSEMDETERKKKIAHIIQTHRRAPGENAIYFMSEKCRIDILRRSVPSNREIVEKYLPDQKYLFNEPWPQEVRLRTH